jgi:hypothetical protein
MDLKAKGLELGKKHLKAFLKEFVVEGLLVVAKQKVQETPTLIDDAVFPAVEKAALEMIEKI